MPSSTAPSVYKSSLAASPKKPSMPLNQSALAEKSDPGIGAHQHIDPHRDRDREHEDVLQLVRCFGR